MLYIPRGMKIPKGVRRRPMKTREPRAASENQAFRKNWLATSKRGKREGRKSRRHNSDFHQETFKVLCKDVGTTENEGESSSRGDKGMNRGSADDEDGERAARKVTEKVRKLEKEKEAMAGTHPTFDLFKWADRLSHEGAICFFLEIFPHTPDPILPPRLFLFPVALRRGAPERI